jgi:hypothetical protein
MESETTFKTPPVLGDPGAGAGEVGVTTGCEGEVDGTVVVTVGLAGAGEDIKAGVEAGGAFVGVLCAEQDAASNMVKINPIQNAQCLRFIPIPPSALIDTFQQIPRKIKLTVLYSYM